MNGQPPLIRLKEVRFGKLFFPHIRLKEVPLVPFGKLFHAKFSVKSLVHFCSKACLWHVYFCEVSFAFFSTQISVLGVIVLSTENWKFFVKIALFSGKNANLPNHTCFMRLPIYKKDNFAHVELKLIIKKTLCCKPKPVKENVLLLSVFLIISMMLSQTT